ncbi:hypothetical protein SCHPADRAFT_895625 [Schizopora paradoxa]|uniref:Chromatin elongation factor SPT5 n=1 Tax=Schizopora paradoxa TaxID=27342 RepID=A0A0H2R9P9_9AGAM|nr:hypothetical protein SCHPADRAFT_895625 [Schizopora paradoxa]
MSASRFGLQHCFHCCPHSTTIPALLQNKARLSFDDDRVNNPPLTTYCSSFIGFTNRQRGRFVSGSEVCQGTRGNVSAFLDTYAAEADGSSSSEEEDESAYFEGIDDEFQDASKADNTHEDHSLQSQFATGDDELDRLVDGIVDRARRNTTSMRVHVESPDDSNVPGITLFAVSVQKGKEKEIIFRLMQKRLDEELKENEANPLRLFKSAFAVPSAPGRIYIETDSFASVTSICSVRDYPLHFVFPHSAFVVSASEAIALICSKPRSKHVTVGSEVVVRGGLYKSDVGIVVSASIDDKWAGRLEIKLKSREPNPLFRKRKRSQSRNAPYVLSRALLESNDAKYTATIADNEDGFLYNGKKYTSDGYRLLTVLSDQVDLQVGTSKEVTTKETTLPNHNPVFVASKSTFKTGDRVVVTQGPFQGHTAYILETIHTTAIIQLSPPGPDKRNGTEWNQDELRLEISHDHLKRSFVIGDLITVVAGSITGRTGFVTSINREALLDPNPDLSDRDTLTVADVDLLEEVQFIAKFEVPASYAAVSSPFVNKPSRNSERLAGGSPVIITAGKHEGRTGTISDVIGPMSLVIEDMTLIKFKVPREAVKYRVEGKHEGKWGSVIREDDYIVTFVENETSKEFRVPRERLIFDPSHQFEMADADDYLGIESDGIRLCHINHRARGFEDQLVYAWHGRFKGRLGTIRQLSGSVAKVHFASAFRGNSVQFVQANYLLAQCACTLAPGKKPNWPISEYSKIKALFSGAQTDSFIAPIPRPRTPETNLPDLDQDVLEAEYYGNELVLPPLTLIDEQLSTQIRRRPECGSFTKRLRIYGSRMS